MSDEYNGWTNRETWAANLCLSNDQQSYSLAKGAVRDGFAKSDAGREELGLEPSETARLNRAGEFLLELVDSLLYSDSGLDAETKESWTRTIGSLWRVDWAAVAESFAAEILEEVEA